MPLNLTASSLRCAGLAFGLSILSLPAVASDALPAHSTGGLTIGSESDPYWFSVSGNIKFDETLFLGGQDKLHNELPSGGNARSISTSFSGGLGQDFSYNVSLSMAGTFSIDDAFLTYKGFGPNHSLSVGQVNSTFCLENANSGKWVPFLERSLPAVAFSACPGIGASWNSYWDPISLKVVATQPKDGNKNTNTHGSDKWALASRLIFSPIHEGGKALHVGLSGNLQDVRDKSPSGAALSDVRFKTRPEARSRRTTSLLDTGDIQATSYYTAGIELAGLLGPAMGEIEYMMARVNQSQPNAQAQFHGWHVTGSYVLTGEHRSYKPATGKFGGVKPSRAIGAWEVAARYSYLNLNDQNIQGGSEHNLTFSLGWYINEHIRFLTNYVRASVHPSNQTASQAKRNIDIVGARIQAVW